MSATEATPNDALNPHGSAWVGANAGAGKTYILVSRLVRLMLDGVAPEKLLCLTYTRAAAAEMQSRLFDLLAEWALLDDAAGVHDGDAVGHLPVLRRHGNDEQPRRRHCEGRGPNRRRRSRRFVDRPRRVQKTGRGLDAGEPEDVISDLRVAIAAGDRGHVPRDRVRRVSPVEL